MMNENSTSKAKEKKKREDLQGIRGLAIISVLLFHFYPHWFPNGFLGVDQFFVLSGFLMCMLLKKNIDQPLCTFVTTFYSRRFKRILPLYFLIIAISMIALYNFFPETAIRTNKQSAPHALVFVSNRPETDTESYFKMMDIAVDIFTHTWSLSVEIQFYFLVPVIFLLGNLLPENYQYTHYIVIGLISFVYHAISPFTTSFNSMFARIWQFSVGMIVYLITISKETKIQEDEYILLMESQEEIENEIEEKEDVEVIVADKREYFNKTLEYLLLSSLVWVVSYPYALPALILRPYFTLATGVIICFSEDDMILSNKFLAYIGDISYSLYLIHWPIYAYWKLTMDNDQIVLVLCLFISVVLSIFCYETYEKWYLKLSSTSIGCLVVLLVIINVIIIRKDEIDKHELDTFGNSTLVVTENMTSDDAEKMNQMWSEIEESSLYQSTCDYINSAGPMGWCQHKGLDKNGNYKIMIFGNSWTANHARMFYEECHHKANTILQGSAVGCDPFYARSDFQRCADNITDFRNHIEEFKPDYGFLISRFIWLGDPMPENVADLNDDPIYKSMITNLKLLVKNVKIKLFVLDAMPRVNTNKIAYIAKSVKNHANFTDIDNYLVDLELYDMARRRYKKLFEDCEDKCVRIDYSPVFYRNDTGTFRFFDDRGFSYYTSTTHLTPHGINRIRHIYTDICKRL